MNTPSVSVIIPAHNAQRFLAEAIESVLAQSHPLVECIVVDDGSTDQTAEVAGRYGDRVRYLHQENAERSAARNNGLSRATGDYVCFLDADDYLAPDKIAEQLAFLEAHPEYDAVYSRVCYFQDGNVRSFYSVKRPTPSGELLSKLIYTNFITIHAPLIRTKVARRAGGFDPALTRYEDWEFFLRLSALGARFGFVDRTNAYVRMHAANTVGDRVGMFQAKCQVVEKFLVRHAPEVVAAGIDPGTVLAFHRADYGRLLILNGRVEEGRSLIREACRFPIPHRRKFSFFSIAAALFGSRALVCAVTTAERLFKYRKGGVGR